MASSNGLGEELGQFAFWLRNPSKGRRPLGDAAVRSCLHSVRRFHQFLDLRVPIQETVEKHVRWMEASGNSPWSIGRYIYALRAYFAFRGLELDLGAPAFQKRLPRWLTDEEWTGLLQVAEHPLWDKNLPERTRVKALFHCSFTSTLVYEIGRRYGRASYLVKVVWIPDDPCDREVWAVPTDTQLRFPLMAALSVTNRAQSRSNR